MIARTLILALLLAGCATQQGLDQSGRGDPAPLAYALPGTIFKLANTVNGVAKSVTVIAEQPEGFRGRAITPEGQRTYFYPGCYECGTDMRIDETEYARLWPLETGKAVAFVRESADGTTARVLISVAGTETIETPAGRFETYRLVGRVQSLTGPRKTALVLAWWAPEVGWVVRAEASDSAGNEIASEVAEITAR